MTKLKEILCVLVGHACVEQGCFGYWHCDRCGEQVGDSLGGAHKPPVIRNCFEGCSHCTKAWAKATFWQRFGVKPNGGGFLQEEDF